MVDFTVELIRDPMFLLVLVLKIKKKFFLYLTAIVSVLVFRMYYLMVLIKGPVRGGGAGGLRRNLKIRKRE